MQSKAKCPYIKEGCRTVLAVNEMEKHIHMEHLSNSLNLTNGKVNGNGGNHSCGDVMECEYKYVGCDIRATHLELQRHLETDVHHHLQVNTSNILNPGRKLILEHFTFLHS
jgi:hypothetical protein